MLDTIGLLETTDESMKVEGHIDKVLIGKWLINYDSLNYPLL